MNRPGELPSVFYQDLAKPAQQDGSASQNPQQEQRQMQPYQQQQQQNQQSQNQPQHQQQQQNQQQQQQYHQSSSQNHQGEASRPQMQHGSSSFARPSSSNPSSRNAMTVSTSGNRSAGQSAQSQNSNVATQQPPPQSTDNLLPIPRAAKTVNDCLAHDGRYPEMETLLTQGVSYECGAMPDEWAPFTKTASYQIPDKIFELYNEVEVVTKMGLFAEIGRAWITVDNKLFLWNFSAADDFQCFDEQNNNITCVKLAKPRPGVFVASITHVLLVATEFDIFILGISATPNGRPNNGRDVTLFNTKMSVPVKSINVSVMVGSAKTGRVFFGGEHDEDVYELTYQEQEKWFQPRCGKICHTQSNFGLTQFAPKLPYFGTPTSTEHTVQMVIDDSRDLLYTLSSSSTIRVFHMKSGDVLTKTITHTLPQTLANVRVMTGSVPIIEKDPGIVSLATVSVKEARRTHLIGTTNSGCRLYFSAVSTEYQSQGSSDTVAPTSMQVLHVRLPPAVEGYYLPQYKQYRTWAKCSIYLTPTRKAFNFAPGYFLCFVRNTDVETDSLWLAAPDTAKLAYLTTTMQRPGYLETGQWFDLESSVEDVELLSAPFSASNAPAGFGNEMAVQFDKAPTDIAVLTNSGIHIFRRRRYVEILATVITGSIANSQGLEHDIKLFFDEFGREEACATTLAIACGALSSYDSRASGRVTDVDIAEYGRKYFIELGGKARVDNEYDSHSIPSLDSVKVSGRHEGIAIYVSRIIRSIWRVPIILRTRLANGSASFSSSMAISKLQIIQEHLSKLSDFLTENKPYIDGLSGAESLMRANSRIEEVAQQAEHRALHSMVQLISAMIEGISFVLVLFDDKLTDIMLSLSPQTCDKILQMSYEGLFTSSQGRDIAKDLVNAIVNRNIAAGSSVDTVTDALRRRCGTFCSTDDVVTFKAVEQLKRAKEMQDPDSKNKLLRESERLYKQVAGTLTIDDLKDAVSEFVGLQFYSGAIRLCLAVAQESDRGNQAMAYLVEGMPEDDPRKVYYDKRGECYQLIFRVLESVDKNAPQLREDAYGTVYETDDEVFQSSFFDWLFSRGEAKQLLDIESQAIVSYLQRKSNTSIEHSDLLWQYFSRRENFYEAASVLRDLAISDFKISLERRIECLSRARSFCNCFCPIGKRQGMNDLLQKVQEEMEVALIQNDVLARIQADQRISETKMKELIEVVNGNLLSMSELFNRYADPYGYMDICLLIFQGADYRGSHEIRKCWTGLLNQTHEEAMAAEGNPHEYVADVFRNLGKRFALSEYIFPPDDLVPMLERYSLEKQPDSADLPWVPQTFLDAGISPEILLRILDSMFFRDEVPFRGSARKKLIKDAIFVADSWYKSAMRTRGRSNVLSGSVAVRDGGFKGDMVIQMLEGYKSILSSSSDAAIRETLERLVADIRRN